MKNLIKIIFLTALFYLNPVVAEEPDHLFSGKHFVVSYKGCKTESLNDVAKLQSVFEEAVMGSGATILASSEYVFSGNGLTMVFLLSESHASIHTYPEFNACFVDLFTCGDHCTSEKFEAILESYLQPTEINKSYIRRD